jgi:hypothetical protein
VATDDLTEPAGEPVADRGPGEAERAFLAGLIARGEAARADEHGQLPPGATHELVEDEAGRTVALRRRFS